MAQVYQAKEGESISIPISQILTKLKISSDSQIIDVMNSLKYFNISESEETVSQLQELKLTMHNYSLPLSHNLFSFTVGEFIEMSLDLPPKLNAVPHIPITFYSEKPMSTRLL